MKHYNKLPMKVQYRQDNFDIDLNMIKYKYNYLKYWFFYELSNFFHIVIFATLFFIIFFKDQFIRYYLNYKI